MCISIYISLVVCCIIFEIHYLHRDAKLISAIPAPFVELLHCFKHYYWYKKRVANTW